MKKQLITTFVLLSLCPAFGRAETIVHDFDALWKASQLSTQSPYTLGTINSDTTYTCSGSNAKFDVYPTTRLGIHLKSNGDQVVMSPPIADLDSIFISYHPAEYRTIKTYISEDNISWTEVEMTKGINGSREFKLPEKGTYYVKFANKNSSNDFYLQMVRYITNPTPVSSCNCLRVVSE